MRHRWLVSSVAAVMATAGCVLGGDPDPAPLSTSAPVTTPPSAVPVGGQQARVRRVVDGDTLRVVPVGAGPLRAGREVRVRLLEMDAPEVGACWSTEATRALAAMLPTGAVVWMVADREPLDRYGRALRYVFDTRGRHVNVALVAAGHARTLLVRPNDARIEEVRAAERQARAARRGLWGACPSG